jgi:hypothetical protein
LVSLPGVLNACGLADINNLLDHIEFTERIKASTPIHNASKIGAVFIVDISDMSDPVIG